MSDLSDYSLNCDYIREEFKLSVDASLYTIVNKITEAYKDLKNKEELISLQAEQPLKQEKKRGRPRKK